MFSETQLSFQELFFRVPVGHHVQLRASVEGMDIVRSYTPVSETLTSQPKDDRRLHFLIKTYPDGALTPKLKKLTIGN